MKTLFKFIFFLILILVVAAVATVVLLPRYFNPNDYKGEIATQVEKVTGRKLTLEGDLQLTFYPWLGASSGRIALGNAQGFGDQPMFSAEKVAVRLQLLPLILKQAVLLDTVVIDRAQVNLARNKEGQTNFDDLMAAKSAPAQPQAGGPKISALVLSGVDVENAALSWDDQQKGQKYAIKDVNLKTGELSLTEPIPFSISGSFDAPQKNLAGDLKIEGKIAVKPDAQQYQIKPLVVTGKLKGRAVPGGASDLNLTTSLDLDMKNGTAELPDLALTALNTQIHGNVSAKNIRSDTPAVNGKLSVDSKNGPGLVSVLTGKPAPAGTAPLKISTVLDADMKAGSIQLSDLTVSTIGTEMKGGLQAKNIQDKDKSSVNGQFTVQSADVTALLKTYGQPAPAVDIKNLNAAAAISGTAQHFKLEPVTLSATASGGQLPKGANDIKIDTRADVDMEKETLNMSDLSVQGLGLSAKGKVDASDIKKAPKYNGALSVAAFDLRQLLQNLNVTLPAMADPKALTQVAVDTAFTGSKQDLSLSGMKLLLDGSHIDGNVSVNDFNSPGLGFNLVVDNINADRYLPPRPPENQPAKPAAGGTSSAAAAAAPTPLPIDMLRKLKLKGDASIGQLVIRNLKLSNVKISINARDGDIAMNPVTAGLYEGTYQGKVLIDARGKEPTLNLEHALKGISAEPLLKDLNGKSKLRGKGNFSLQASSHGADANAIKQNLNGQGDFSFQNGAVKGFNIGKFLRKAQTGFIGHTDPNEETDFSELTGTYKIVNGVVQNNDLAAKSPLLRVDGKGSANLVNETIDYLLNVNVVATAEGQGGKELTDLSGLTVPMKVSGTFSDPSFAPDFAGIVKARAEKEVKKQLGKVLPVPIPGLTPDSSTSGSKDTTGSGTSGGGDIQKSLKKLLKF
ncbi:MAG TPA: AsmA family protein [Gammaproteobacteria bacterium]|nr:AsmA family protein [Gammaproteobacteria bacterium]